MPIVDILISGAKLSKLAGFGGLLTNREVATSVQSIYTGKSLFLFQFQFHGQLLVMITHMFREILSNVVWMQCTGRFH